MSADKKKIEPRAIGSVISRNLPPVFQMAFKLAQMERQWAEIVGPRLAERSKPVSMENGSLVVVCESPAAAQLLRMCAGTLTLKVKKMFGVQLAGVRSVVGRVERPRRSAPAAPRPLKVSRAAVEEAFERISPQIKDPDTALALARLEAAAKARFGSGRKKTPEERK